VRVTSTQTRWQNPIRLTPSTPPPIVPERPNPSRISAWISHPSPSPADLLPVTLTIMEKVSTNLTHIGMPIFDAEAKRVWLEAAGEAIEKVRQNRAGSGLVQEIDASPRTVHLLKAGGQEPVNRTWCLGSNPAQYQSIADAKRLSLALEKAMATRPLAERPAAERRLKKLVQDRCTSITWKIGLEIERVEMNSTNAQLIMCELDQYDCLPTGDGADCYIRWNPVNDFVGSADLDRNDPKNRWRNRPPWIGLAHELIHAWRFLTGRQIFGSGTPEVLMDEQLTSGVPPFVRGRYTENNIRYWAFQVMRPFYGSDHGR
jgi:hypothetical protein